MTARRHDRTVDTRVNAAAWNAIARQDRTSTDRAEVVPARMEWTHRPGTGPGAELLGDVRGARVIELGCNRGDNLAHVATLGPARTVGLDVAEDCVAQARARWAHVPGIAWTTGEAGDFLAASRETYDVVYSIFGALWYTDPERLLPRVRERLAPGGLLAFTVSAARPGALHGARVDNLTLGTGVRMPVVHYAYDAAGWHDLLARHRFIVERSIDVPTRDGAGHRALVFTARAA
ncbi:class I SAM-dependent methyltransferase [Embleya sp. NPDC005575]|uniref:class I SAM-dependent methyltransferase n=1 Tax=Embleya sp. NPDC005575 TaxID=3156892 RepID=UPI0033AAF56A